MTVNDRYSLQSKQYPDQSDPERFMPMGAVGSGSYSLTAPPADLLKMYGKYIYGARSDQNLITLYHTIPEIYCPVDAIARRVVNANFQLKRISDDEVIAKYKPWNDLYESPNPLQTFRELLYEAVTYQLVTGKNYLYKNVPETLKKKVENIAALWNLPADRMQPVYDYAIKLFSATKIEDIIKEYQLYDGVNTGQFPTDLVLHSRTINLDWIDRRLKGKSPLLAADIAICNIIAVYEARNVIYTKRGALGAIVSAKEDASGPVPMTPKEKRGIREANTGEFGLTGNKDLFPIYDTPVEFIQFGMSIKDLQPFDETRADMAAIYSVLNVPFDLAPQDEGTTFDNLNNAMRSVYTNTAIPLANTWMEGLTKFLGLKDAGYYLYADFSKIHELQENKKEQAQVEQSNSATYKSLFLSGVCTLNEWCVKQGFDQSPNPLYDFRVFDMTPEQISQIEKIYNMSKPTPTTPAPGNLSLQNPQDIADASNN